MSAPPITTLEEATPEWLTDALTDTLPVGTRVTHVDAERIGEQVGIASALYRMKLTYSSKATGPTTLILKLNLQEGAIHDIIANRNLEVREGLFYELLGEHVNVRIAKAHFVAHEASSNRLTLILEDFEPARLYGLDPYVSLTDAEAVIETIAKHHANFWNSPVIRTPAFAPVTDSPNRNEDARKIAEGLAVIKEMAPATLYLQQCIETVLTFVADVPEKVEVPRPYTLLHGDFHRNNIAFKDDDNEVLLFDWQLTEYGAPAQDLANFMFTSMSMETIREHMPLLLDRYWQQLKDQGIRYGRRRLNRDLRLGIALLISKVSVLMGAIRDDVPSMFNNKEFLIHADELAQHYNIRQTMSLFPLVIRLMRLQVWLQRTVRRSEAPSD